MGANGSYYLLERKHNIIRLSPRQSKLVWELCVGVEKNKLTDKMSE